MIGKLLADGLAALTALTGSAGLAIVLLTILIRVFLHPLTRWSLKSMKKMQALAPQVEVLRRKHKDDPRQANVEIMSLYRSSGANPFGGCLPVLIQFPVLIALFRVLQRQELFKGQAFLGLPLDAKPTFGSMAHDPLLALIPILVGLTTYWQQRMSITDPQQARLFIFMPILIAWFSLGFPIALSLYWIVSTVVYIVEYYIVVGRPLRPAPALSRVPASRRPADRQSRKGG